MPSAKENKPVEYVLHLRVMPTDDGDDKGIRRLRRLLKNLVRHWGLRCVAIRPPMPDETEAGE